MSSLKCAQCGLVNFATATTCKRCGQAMVVSSGPEGIVLSDGYVLPPPPTVGTPGSGVWRDKDTLIMSKDAELPDRCGQAVNLYFVSFRVILWIALFGNRAMRSTKSHERTRSEGVCRSLANVNLMKFILTVMAIFVLSSFANAQSGRRVNENKTLALPPPEPVIGLRRRAALPERMSLVVDMNKDYRCVSDGGPERILGSEALEEVAATKGIDLRAEMRKKPRPAYTKEARRLRIQGFVTLRVLLSASGKISRVRVMKGLRAGLTENAIRAACKIEFKPAIKTGLPVAQWVTAEYVFRFADSFIFRP